MEALAVLHLADLFRDPRMRIPSHRDWAKVRPWLRGEWPQPVPARLVVTAANADGLPRVVELAKRASFVVIDTEYTIPARELTLIGVGFRHPDTGEVTGFQVPWRSTPGWLRDRATMLLRDVVSRSTMVSQNAIGAELPTMKAAFGLEWKDYRGVEDTMLAHAVLWSEWPHTLEFLASLYGAYPKMKHLSRVDPLLYNWGDVVDTLAAWEGIQREFAADPAAEDVYREQSLKLIPIVWRAHERGLKVNQPRVVPAMADLDQKMQEATKMAQSSVGYPINVGSNDQLKLWVYDIAALPIQVNKETRQPSVGADAVATLRKLVGPEPDFEDEDRRGLSFETAEAHIAEGALPLLEARVIYMAAQQAKTHYIDPLFIWKRYSKDRKPVKKDGFLAIRDRIYPEHHIHAQANGRWSTVEPPVAQLPNELRDIVIPDVGETWLGWDWDQFELRIIAALSGDRPTLEAFEHGWDIHTLNACDIFGLSYPPDRTDPHKGSENAGWRATVIWGGKEDLRRVFAKRFVYRLNYGGGPRTAGDIPGARALGLNPRTLVQASQRYLAAHPGLAKWRLEVSLAVSKPGVLPVSRTWLGRPRVLLSEGKKRIREAFDHPMQAGVSDVANLVAVQLVAEMPYLELAYQMFDGWWWACPDELVETSWPRVREIVERTWDVKGVEVKFPATFKQQCSKHLDCFKKERRSRGAA